MLTIVLFTCTMLTEAACAALLQCATLHYRSQDVLFARVIHITPCCTQDRRPVYHALLSLMNHSQADFWQPPQQAPLHRTVLPQGPSKNNWQLKLAIHCMQVHATACFKWYHYVPVRVADHVAGSTGTITHTLEHLILNYLQAYLPLAQPKVNKPAV